MNVAVIGAGRVGLVAAACLADFGIKVRCVDNQKDKIECLQSGNLPFHEPGLAELIQKNMQAERLDFTTALAEAVRRSLVIFIAVGTEEENEPGVPNLKPLFAVSHEIAKLMSEYKVLVIKSTVPVGTARRLRKELKKGTRVEFDVVSNPEFLREGSAIENFMRPDRVVLGGRSEQALAILRDIYRPLYLIETPVVVTTSETAELAKYASNAFLALKISFINEMANFADAAGVDVHDVAKVLGLDRRIGPKFLHPGVGFGGSCLPKDARALVATARQFDLDLPTVAAALETNRQIGAYLVKRIRGEMGSVEGRTIAVLGLAYKPMTDDVREAPAIAFVRELLENGAAVQAYDPAAMAAASEALQDNRVRFCPSAYEAATGADALAILTEWNEFRNLDLNEAKKVMKGHLILDGRNVLDPDAVVSHGFTYFGRGRSPRSSAEPASPRLTTVGAGGSAEVPTVAVASESDDD